MEPEHTGSTVIVEEGSDASIAQQEAAMEEGFSETRQEETGTRPPHTPEPADDSTSAPPTSSDAPATAQASPAPPEDPVITITQSQWDQILTGVKDAQGLRESLRSVGGQVGGLKQLVETLRASTPAGKAIELTPQDFAELGEEYPFLVDPLVKGLNRRLKELAIKGTGEAPAVDPSTFIDQIVQSPKLNEFVENTIKTREEVRVLQRLDEKRPDWRTVVGKLDPITGIPEDTEYRRWLKSQGEPYEKRLLSSWDESEILDSLTKFDTYQEHQKKATAKANSATNAKDKRRAELSAAVQPRGVPGTAKEPTEEDAAEEAFREARRTYSR